MENHILVPLDGTMVAHMALPHAAALARATSSKLILLHVAPPATASSVAYSLSRAARATAMHGHFRDNGDRRDGFSLLHRYLEATAEDIRDEGLPVRTEILEGDPAPVITSRAANDPSIWTIVMATRSSGADRSFNRSVTEKVLRTSVPILLVHPDEKIDSLRSFYKRAYQTILVPLDGSSLAEQALEPAQMLARAMGASLLLLSVLPDPYAGEQVGLVHASAFANLAGFVGETGVPTHKGAEAREGDDAARAELRRGYLFKTAVALRSAGLPVRAQVAHGTLSEEILRPAADATADLIVMSVCCRDDLECLLGGSVIRQVAQEAKVPVMLVRAQIARCQEQTKQRSEEPATLSSAAGVVAQVPARA